MILGMPQSYNPKLPPAAGVHGPLANGLVAAYRFNEGAGVTAFNSASSHLKGTLTGFVRGTAIIVSGGTGGNAVYNQTYYPNGTNGGYIKYVSADGSYWCVYDDMAIAWVLCPAGDTMSAVASDGATETPVGGSWTAGFSVAAGALQDGPWLHDAKRDFLRFDGSQYISVPDSSLFNSNALTVVTLIRPHTFTNYQQVFAKTQARGTSEDFGIIIKSDGQWYFETGVAASNWRPALSLNQWQVVAGSTDDTTQTGYVNGISSGTDGGAHTYWANDPFCIGCSYYSGAPSRYFDGDIAFVGFWNRVLSPTEHLWIAREFLAGIIDPLAPPVKRVWLLSAPAGGAAISASRAGTYAARLSLAQSRASSYGEKLAIGRDAAASYGAGETVGLEAYSVSSYAVLLDLAMVKAASYAAGLLLDATASASYGAGEAVAEALSNDAGGSYGAGLAIGASASGTYGADGIVQGEYALSSYTHLSDVAQMADGSVWVSRYASEGISASLLRVASYEQTLVGLCGDRSVYEMTAQVTEHAGPAAGKGIISLHPAGYALAHSSAGNLQLWRYAAGGWSLLTETDPEPVPEALIGTPLLGAYRLEVIGGDLYVLPRNGDDVRGFALRGSVLVPLPAWDSSDAAVLPRAVRGYLSAVCPRREQWSKNTPLACFWRGYWHYTEADNMLRRAGDGEWQVPFQGGAALINVQGALTVIGQTDDAYFPGIHSEFPLPDGAAAGGFLSYYGNRLQRGLVDMWPFASRNTGSVLWCIGINAFDLQTHKQEMIGPGGFAAVFYAFPWETAALRLYSVGPVPDKVCALSATLEWAETPVSPNLLSATLEWSTGAGEQRPSVTAATLEWSGGSGSARPTVTALTLEWHSRRSPRITAATLEWAGERARSAMLSATLEWATGAGTEKPTVTEATLEWASGSGNARPSVTAATLEWADASARPALLEATLEWAQALPVSETVGVCWQVIELTGKAVNLVRLTEVVLDSGFTWIIRTNDADPVDAYGSYIELTPYALTEVPAGSMVRLGVIGPLAQDVPTSTLQLYCEPTAI